ncbi:MAG: MotA/TolQ/ExbB proton channel family protein [Planctomycetota bacterium]|nr:MotA/TolQ/ExbB proton channel family protein [Planctomycetota bacterium]
MDIATILGLIGGFGLIFTSIAMGGGGLGPFIDVPSGMIVFGGAAAASFINFPMGAVLGSFGVIMKCFLFKLPNPIDTVKQFKSLAEVVRKEGLLALESKLEEVDDTFMKSGLESLIAGTSTEDTASVLENELAFILQRHVLGKKIVDSAGAAAPAFGMIGTLIGLVQMLQNLSDPSKIGGGMATALLTTLYGAMVSNVICIPLAGKLETRNNEESMLRELMVRGIVLLGEGTAPRALEEQLLTYLAPKTRAAAADK